MMRYPPSLIGYGRDGIPQEFFTLVSQANNDVRSERGESTVSGDIEFLGEAVDRLCHETLAQLERERALFAAAKRPAPSRSKPERPKLSTSIACMTYMLHAYCAHWRKPSPVSLLWLTFEAFGLQEQRPSAELTTRMEIGPPVDDKMAWLNAAALDGEADARAG
jgi:hypothetical protein